MGENGNGGRVSLTQNDILRWAAVFIAIGGLLARFEYRTSQVEAGIAEVKAEIRELRAPLRAAPLGVKTGSGTVELDRRANP